MLMICTKHGEVEEKLIGKNNKRYVTCSLCHKEYVKRKIAKRTMIKENLVRERGGRCLDCNQEFEYGLFDFHHRDPGQKDFAISRSQWLSDGSMSKMELIKREVEKCDMLCPVCHRRRHYTNAPAPRLPKDKTRLKHKTMMVEAFGGKCWSCNKELEYFNFDFHHLDDSKKEFSLSLAMVNCLQLPKLMEEAKKCAMLCVICHRKLHQSGGIQIQNKVIDFSIFDKELATAIISRCKICDTEISRGSSHCAVHAAETKRKVQDRPSKEHLLQLLSQNSCVKVSKMYGVSDKCIKKWLK